jgi:fatty-acyl-CoA synthase
MTLKAQPLKTTKYADVITSISDIEALERRPYDELVPARNLYELFEATALLHPERPALTVMKTGDLNEIPTRFSHRELLGGITKAANLFRSLGVAADSGPVARLKRARELSSRRQVLPSAHGPSVQTRI